MENIGSKGFILTTNIYKSPNYAALVGPKKWKPEGRIHVARGADAKKQCMTQFSH